ncbi:hypothetical protein K8I28_03595 [bacterium]|nr:hypothetical protein [bacterium]
MAFFEEVNLNQLQEDYDPPEVIRILLRENYSLVLPILQKVVAGEYLTEEESRYGHRCLAQMSLLIGSPALTSERVVSRSYLQTVLEIVKSLGDSGYSSKKVPSET